MSSAVKRTDCTLIGTVSEQSVYIELPVLKKPADSCLPRWRHNSNGKCNVYLFKTLFSMYFFNAHRKTYIKCLQRFAGA